MPVLQPAAMPVWMTGQATPRAASTPAMATRYPVDNSRHLHVADGLPLQTTQSYTGHPPDKLLGVQGTGNDGFNNVVSGPLVACPHDHMLSG